MPMSFADLGSSSAVVNALLKRGFENAFPIQELVVPDVLGGHDVLIQSPTGSGKTLAFGVPLMDRIEATDKRPSALILAPTRELALQIVEETRELAHARALSITAVYGGVGLERQARNAARSHILVATPGRLEDLLQRRAFTLANVKLLILDEADRMLDMGFRPAVDRIVRATNPRRQTMLFSATLKGEVDKIATEYTTDARRHELAPAPERVADIDHRFLPVVHEAKLDHLVHELRHHERGLTLVFVRTKRGADRLVKRLRAQNVESVAMHGDKTQGQRERALARFERGEVDVLVATDVAARGIDVNGVSHVINFDAPEDREGYVHRIGRTGRAGATGIGVTFVMADQARDIGKIAVELGLQREFAETGFNVDVAPQRQGRQGGGGGQGGGRNRTRRRRGGSGGTGGTPGGVDQRGGGSSRGGSSSSGGYGGGSSRSGSSRGGSGSSRGGSGSSRRGLYGGGSYGGGSRGR
ncbi:DEAD/DEAH box helicase [Conexibacter sp. CPCC 206217]|uniref:DEAD/DEAH box helicase n=1 Tax=Conexibacter sp. CPCC 206217 TaxID=3064574 RepID=UPI0027279AAB|nr:DEAD/DEAH box helicase [Conexibacter sp. CPCC 206217]MDO8212988.1 DEAD/DEAH box helicase [Conexibacter sp. CPCC 206217]